MFIMDQLQDGENEVCRLSAPEEIFGSLRAEDTRVNLEPKDRNFTTGITGSHNLEFPNGHNCSVFSNEWV